MQQLPLSALQRQRMSIAGLFPDALFGAVALRFAPGEGGLHGGPTAFLSPACAFRARKGKRPCGKRARAAALFHASG